MKTLENARRTMRQTMGRVIAAAAFGAMAIASVPAQAADASDALYRTDTVQPNNQHAARLMPTDLSIGIDLGHIFSHRRDRHKDRHRHSDSHSQRNENRYYGRSRRHKRSSEGYHSERHESRRGSMRNGRSYRDSRH